MLHAKDDAGCRCVSDLHLLLEMSVGLRGERAGESGATSGSSGELGGVPGVSESSKENRLDFVVRSG